MAERTLHFELIVNCIETNESTVIGICEAESPAGAVEAISGLMEEGAAEFRGTDLEGVIENE